MRLFISSVLISVLCQAGMAKDVVKTLVSDHEFKVPAHAKDILGFNCYECHDDDRQKGDVQLDNLEDLSQPARLELLNKVLEQVYSGEMPPRKADQPTEKERDQLVKWTFDELNIFNASKLGDKLRYYRYGNYVNHDKLFRGDIKTAPSSPSRRWRVNEMIYHERINDIFELKGRERRPSFHGVVKPFNLPTESGVKYYDNQAIEGGHFLTLMSNAKWVVDKQLRPALLKSGEFKFPKAYLETQANNKRKLYIIFPDERWNPKVTAQAFERVIVQDGTPSDSDLKAAINHQFKVVLQREPTTAEMSKYLQFTKNTMKLSDKTSALKKMMTSIIMEPEFLYRSEFGGGKPGTHGRTMLTPRELSYALAYALTDRIPDAKLVQAAESGKLNTRADLKRETLRILDEGSIEKPRILRFFQDYFGYYGVYDIFKDEERFVGAYNPHRVVAAKYIYRIPGKVSREADTLVRWILKEDKNVFETLLTTDKFFVHHNGNNDEMTEKAEKVAREDKINRKMYNKLKGLKGKELLKAAKPYKKYFAGEDRLRRRFSIDMKTFAILYGKDGKKGLNRRAMPKGIVSGTDDLMHSIKMYNLDYTEWSYEPVQPVKIENRAGMLTHPAWLVSYSHNAATDPIVRGKWIREKLLGGFIADVPITVDAKVPDDPHKTLRERFSVTTAKDCRSCHEKMNPLGFVLESYDDFGRFRKQESIEYPENILSTETQSEKGEHGVYANFKVPTYKSKPVNALGYLRGTGDKTLDGEVTNAKDMMDRLAKSDRVRQVFIRNVFRYFMGRNETLSDSETLIKADKVYLETGGSFKALMVSLLTSDSFIYRK